MSIINLDFLEQEYPSIKEKSIKGRWVTFKDIKGALERLSENFENKQIGNSEEGIPIYKLKLGSGKKKILIWSQMHGNESTGTKAVFDFLNFIATYQNSEIVI